MRRREVYIPSSKGERFRNYAARIVHEVSKFEWHETLRKRRLVIRGLAGSAMAKRWLALHNASSERFVKRIVEMVEEFEA